MNEADIPIDIHTGKLQDWLISRRICPKNSQAQIKNIRTKIAKAITDMPEREDLVKLLSGAHINYFHCKQIVEILKQTEKDTKSVFGTYGSQRMKDWQEVVKLYERENIYLGEAAQILVRNVTYEIPSIKKQMLKLEQQSEDALKRIQDLGKTENILLNEHAAICQQLGIKGENLREEFMTKLKELPEMYSNSVKSIGTLKEAVDVYGEFIENSSCLPILRHVIKHGNTTVYQYLNKEAPLAIEEIPINLILTEEKRQSPSSDKDSHSDEIDFGDDNSGETTSAEVIDFGDVNGDSIQLETGDIDWGDDTIQTPGSGGGVSKEIDFDVPLEEYGIVVEGVGMDGGTAKGDQAYTILDSPNYHHKFLDELYELESFLKLRHYELNAIESSTNIMFSLMDNISTHDAKSIAKMLKYIAPILGNLMDERIQHLFQLKHSSKYADLLASKLRRKLSAVEKIKATKEILKGKSIEFNNEKEKLNPILDEMIKQTKELQNNIENDISKRYKNRIVNLMGGISAI